MEPDERPAPAEPIKVEVVGALHPWRDVGWWFTTTGPVVIAALALVVAILSLVDQHGAEQTAQAAASRTYASQVSFSLAPAGQFQFEIDNFADAQITSVLVQRAAHATLDPLGTIGGCTGISVTLPSAAAPVMYFRDANGLGWELPLNGVAEPSADPSAILDLLPANGVATRPPAEGTPEPLHGC